MQRPLGLLTLDVLHPFASRQLPAMMLGAARVLPRQRQRRRRRRRPASGAPDPSATSATTCRSSSSPPASCSSSRPIVLAAAAYTVADRPAVPGADGGDVQHRLPARRAASTPRATTRSPAFPTGPRSTRRSPTAIEDERVPASCCSWTSTASRRSTTRSATATAICCSSRSPSASRRSSAATGRSPGSAATSSRSSAPAAIATRPQRWRDRIADALRDPFELEEMVVDVQASVGIALFPEHGRGVETLLQKADVAMYRAKETRSDVALYDERHDHHSPAKLALTAELRTAVGSEEIVLCYQPELDLRTPRGAGRRGARALGSPPPRRPAAQLVRADGRGDEPDQAAHAARDGDRAAAGRRLARAGARHLGRGQHLRPGTGRPELHRAGGGGAAASRRPARSASSWRSPRAR